MFTPIRGPRLSINHTALNRVSYQPAFLVHSHAVRTQNRATASQWQCSTQRPTVRLVNAFIIIIIIITVLSVLLAIHK